MTLQSKQLPDAYPRTQAHYNILGAIRGSLRPNEIKGTGLAWKVEKKEIVDETEGGGFTINQDHKADLFHCDIDQEKRQVPSVEVPVEGFIGQVLAAVRTLVDNVLNLITGTVCTDEERKDCYSTYGTRVDILKTATVFSPGSIDLQEKSTGETKGSLLTFLPQRLADGLRRANAGTNKTQTGGNVLGISAEEDVPHYQMYTVKKGFQLTSSCMLMPASMQAKDADCTLPPPKESGTNAVPGTSTWAQQPGAIDPPCSGSGLDVATRPPAGKFLTTLKEVAAKENIPECVLAGVAHIEGGWRMPEKPADQCKPANSCSATGPMQFTTGPQPGINCTACAANYCPNAWSVYGNGNPCRYEDSLRAAAKLLKTSGLAGSSPQGQEATINEAGYRYYGNRRGVCRLGKGSDGQLRSYGQFLVDYCKNY
ncbi:hypothetical protein HYV22_02905 [Candidatus Gottesmanbacteria bacterium]|nr:hypothetical protein [Candidatus Gottesmanbacteria bacterium]